MIIANKSASTTHGTYAGALTGLRIGQLEWLKHERRRVLPVDERVQPHDLEDLFFFPKPSCHFCATTRRCVEGQQGRLGIPVAFGGEVLGDLGPTFNSKLEVASDLRGSNP